LLAQRGDDLGARLTHVFDDLLAQHAAVLVLDADSPTLPMTWVAEGVAMLAAEQADVVLGPSDDGGYWSIGLRTRCPALFADVPWSTERVLETTLARADAVTARGAAAPRGLALDRDAAAPAVRQRHGGCGGARRRSSRRPNHARLYAARWRVCTDVCRSSSASRIQI